MKILFIDVNCKNSSTGDIVYNLHKYCTQKGIISNICYGRGPKINEANIFKFGLDFETSMHAFLTRVTGFTGCFSYFSTRRLIRHIKRFKPDIVHIHELHAYFVNVKQLLMYLKKNNIKTVFTNHCEFLYTGKCGYSKKCMKFVNDCGHCPLLREYPKSLLFDRTKFMINSKKKIFKGWNSIYIISPSQWIYGKTKMSFLKNVANAVVHNGIDTNIFNFSKKENHQKTVLAVASNVFSAMKGGYKVLSIAQKMQDVKFIIVGAKKPFPIYKGNNVQIFGNIKNKRKLAELYSNADCFLMLSAQENFPTTSLEAQCCGTKVIGCDVGGVKETILENNGYVVSNSNENELIEVIKDCIHSDYDKTAVSKKSCEYYSFNTMFEKYLKIYEGIID